MNTKLLEKVAEVILKEEEYLTDLDREIGDGDHGVNLARGFGQVKEDLAAYQDLPEDEAMKKIGMTLLTKVGGASGALYGSAFLAAAMNLKGKSSLSDQDILDCFHAMIEGVQKRGKAEVGEKTMIDTLVPVYDYMKAEVEAGKSLEDIREGIVAKAKAAMEATEALVATKGRASYLGERAKGHLDPGAVSSYLMIKTICEE